MNPLQRALAVFVCSFGVSAAAVWLADDAHPGVAPMEAAAGASSHDLSRLRVLHEALAPVGEAYVEPERVDPERMYVAALEAVERLVPEVMFRRVGDRLEVHIGEHRETLEVGHVADLRTLQRELRRVAALLEAHLAPDDVPNDDPDVDPLALVEFAMGNGALATLDPHSALLPPEQSREMDVENRGEFGGLGINVQVQHDEFVVVEAFDGKPAAIAGVRDGDRIRRIDGQSTINLTLDEAVDLLRGPVGESVALEVVGRGDDAPREIVVRRENIKFNEVEGHLLPARIGYVRIPAFHATVHRDLVDALQRLERQSGGLHGLVLDLRDDPGGYLNQAIAVADTFLRSGEIVSTRGPYDRRPSVEEAVYGGTEGNWPMVVLVNASSASASEIVAGALRNNQRAVIVGERTFGKGSVQNLHPLPYDSKLKITIAHYLTPGEHSIQAVGIPADVELVPATIGQRKVDPEGTATYGDAELFGRERVEREADLDAALERRDLLDERPMYRIVYPRTWETAEAGPLDGWGAPHPERDPELSFAMDLLRTPVPGGRVGRGDLLAAAGPLVARVGAADDARVVEGFRALGIDWSDGPTPATPALDVRLQLGAHGRLVAGEDEEIALTVTNRGTEPIHRLAAVLADHEALDGLEFFFGKLLPGASRTWKRRVDLGHGWPAEVGTVSIRLRDDEGHEIARTNARVEVEGHPRPQLGWAWQIEPPADGRVDVGDVVRVRLDVRNTGDGPSHGATGRIRNRAGRALDVLGGTVAAGRMVGADGRPCAVLEPGWEAGAVVGEAGPNHPRIAGRLPPRWADGCVRVLAPGETWTGAFEVRVLEAVEGGYRLDLSIEDVASYDHVAIVREGFLGTWRNEEPLRFALGAPGLAVDWREPPRIALTAVPDAEVHAEVVRLAGAVTDADGVDHVLVFADDDKVFFEGTPTDAGLPAIPFSTSVPLAPGLHTLTVLARDVRGFSSTASAVVSRRDATFQAARP